MEYLLEYIENFQPHKKTNNPASFSNSSVRKRGRKVFSLGLAAPARDKKWASKSAVFFASFLSFFAEANFMSFFDSHFVTYSKAVSFIKFSPVFWEAGFS